MDPIKIKIKSGNKGDPPYWYVNEIGKEFFVIYDKDAGTHLGNGFPVGVFVLIYGMNPGPFDHTNNMIRPQDVRVVVG